MTILETPLRGHEEQATHQPPPPAALAAKEMLPVVTRTAGGRAGLTSLSDLPRYRELIKNLVLRDVKSRYKQSALGIAWAILNPLLFSLIQTLILIYILKSEKPGGIPAPVFAYFGNLFWGLFSTGLSGASESLVAHTSLITKVNFPREVFPFAAVAGKLVDFGFGLTGLLPLLLIFHTVPALTMVAIVPLLAIQVLFTLGLGMLLACANLFYRDVRHLVALGLMLWMYTVPILYPLEKIPENLRFWYLLNPMASLLEASRRLTFPQATGPVAWSTLGLTLGIAVVVSIALFFGGYAVFKRNEPRFAEVV